MDIDTEIELSTRELPILSKKRPFSDLYDEIEEWEQHYADSIFYEEY